MTQNSTKRVAPQLLVDQRELFAMNMPPNKTCVSIGKANDECVKAKRLRVKSNARWSEFQRNGAALSAKFQWWPCNAGQRLMAFRLGAASTI
ncbi:hypothetical protein ERJ75_000858300 [Trypanosoma vivax]|nr:hypothetical protein ERJ75_000858300 [Trypanosoma vivax]